MNPEDIPLRDLQLPAVGGWWPLAPGWWVIIAILAVALLLLLRHLYRRWRWQAPRRIALRQLAAIRAEFEHGTDAAILGKSLSELVRRAMLAYSPRNEVAGLTGNDWLAWLDQGLDDQPFSSGPGKILESLPYMNPASVDLDTDVRGLIEVVQTRLREPLPRASVTAGGLA